MEKTKKDQDLYKKLEIDPVTQKCTDKIEIVSMVHGTGQIVLITKKGKEIKIRVDDLINQLLKDQSIPIVEGGYTIFENSIVFKYPTTRSNEYERIYRKANLVYFKTNPYVGIMEVVVHVNNLLRVRQSVK